MKKITFDELWNTMFKFNCDNPEKEDKCCLCGVVVYKQSNWKDPCTVKQRSYEVWNNNRAFQPNKIANSIFANCLDGKDLGVRLDWYRWDVEYCYMKKGE